MKRKWLAGVLALVMMAGVMPGSLMEKIGVKQDSEAAVTLRNPRIAADSSQQCGQKVTYDCVWFGTYPQTEIVDQASNSGLYGNTLTQNPDYEINATLYSTLTGTSDWNSSGDIVINGIKYRRIMKSDAYETASDSNHYNWDAKSGYHYFRYDKIKWRVLSVEEGKIFLMADQTLDAQPYSLSSNKLTWETCTTRTWLNDYFLSMAFTSSEQNEIPLTSLKNDDSLEYGTSGGNDTDDKVFLLAESDLYTENAVSYGFLSDKKIDNARNSYGSAYAKAMGLTFNNNNKEVCWWTRSPGQTKYNPIRVVWPGGLSSNGYSVNDGIRPALYLDLSSPSYSYAGILCTDGTMNELGYTEQSGNVSTYSITYDANGGSGAPAAQTKTAGTDLMLSNTIPSKTGYTFVGWGMCSSDETSTFSAGETYNYDSDVTLYAIWKKTINLRYNGNGGSGIPATESVTLYNDESSYTFTINDTVPTRSGYTFIGWGTSSSTALYTGGDLITLSENTSLYAVWDSSSASSYKITYHANGGSDAPASQTKTKGTSITLRTETPTRTGYTFEGWGTGNSATSPSYSAGGTYSQDASIILYAIWKKTITINYQANGGTNAPSCQSVAIYNSATECDITIPESLPVRDGYTFMGWGRYSSSSSSDYSPGNTYTFNSSMTLYAIWIKYVALRYDANGGSGTPIGYNGICYNEETSHTFTIGKETPTRNGYTFLGWSTSQTAATASYQGGDKITISSDTTLYAVWEALPYETYTVTYHPNYGTGVPDIQIKTEGEDLILSNVIPTRTGYTFLGWSSSSNAKTADYSPGQAYTTDADIDLYAIWKKTITLTYDANGGNSAPSSQSVDIYNYSTTYTFTVSSLEPDRDGHRFLGWSTGSNAVEASYHSGDSIILSTSTTLYAVWEEVATTSYTISYNANGGSGAPSSQTKTQGTILTLSTVIPERTGYSFVGWGTASSSTSVSYNPGDSYIQDANITLYAIWKKPITLTYDPNGGSSSQSSTTYYAYNSATSKTFTITSSIPSRSGYTFLGWDENKNSGNPAYSAGDTLVLSSNTTIYAIWRKKITLTYDANGGSGAPAITTGYIYNSETEFSFTISEVKPTRDGYLFGGWSLLSSDVVGPYAAGDKITCSSDATLYATWMKITSMIFTVTYQANGGTGAPDSQSKDGGVDLTLSNTVPTRAGYTFIGWGTSSTAREAVYSPGSTYSKDSNIILYALWEKKLTLSYDGNGGNNVPASQSTTIYNETTSHTFTISTTEPVRSGYTFVGWGTGTDATSTYGSGEQITITEDKTLYAIWSQNSGGQESVTLTYSGENGGENIPASRTVDKNRDINLSGLRPFKEGYEFLGWNPDKDATSAVYAPEDEIRVSSDITLYAIWKKSIILSYDGNEGEGIPSSEKGTIYNKAIIYTFRISYDSPVRDGYIFLGWNESKYDQAACYAPGDEIDLSEDKTLYAIWREDKDNKPDTPTTEEPSSTEREPAAKMTQTITASDRTIAIGSKQVSLGAKNSGDGKLTYTSSNTKAATISATGIISPKGYGTTYITIRAAETSLYKKTEKRVTVTVVPKKAKLTTAKSPARKTLILKWKKDKTATKYEIQLCMKKDFKKKTLSRTFGKKVVKQKITNMKSKTWYVRIRAWKKVGGKTYYGIWSTVKKVKVK